MAVWPFCLPWPRTSVTVIPDTPICSSASRTSSTLLGLMMALINFIVSLQRALQIRRQRRLCVVRQLVTGGRDVEDVDRLGAFRRNQHQIDVTPMPRDHLADAMQQSDFIARDDIQNRILLRREIVRMDHRDEAAN